jgi:L-histidine N-alpha-methyltransferase
MSSQVAPWVSPPEAVVADQSTQNAVADAAREGLTASPKWLPAWLFYDAEGSRLFERITVLPEYYLTRTERAIFTGYADGMIDAALAAYATATGNGEGKQLRLLELGAGSASKTGILLAAAVRRQGTTQYLPVDVSETAMEFACSAIERALTGVQVLPQVANYVTDELSIPPHDGPTLALYIGSSIGNFAPDEAVEILRKLCGQLRPGDSLLLGTDLVKASPLLLAAYDDSDGVTAAFNMNVLHRLNRDLRASFDLDAFRHEAIWNPTESRMEMHLRSTRAQTVRIPALGRNVAFAAGETIHTENSYKFTPESIAELLQSAGFRAVETWTDEQNWFAVTLATVA